MISETEAKMLALSFITAMVNEEKEARETLYEDLDVESLKRMMRWVARFHWPMMHELAAKRGMTMQTFWQRNAISHMATIDLGE